MLDPKQLLWRCRRGVRELDVLFNRYVDSSYNELDTEHKKAFERLLEVQDPIIMDWVFGKSESKNKEINNIIKELKDISNN